ncbi:hypothetical protein [Micavibrio aeruginosavorus]|uniref:Uncharacterized protein n=1 Tax=Micavibrio aeruginosavorus (strain ARL-13) TaxID=856793 RepID=G2KMZ5_MICAA|nr:hypothetical protein [Micavibrio aeruginosavorus]AEP08927.1 hypothetical protein MICA_590 [Micavibrio aeruginosavorus ARL-13]
MTNQWDTFKAAFDEATRTIRIADNHVNDMAGMVRGRLRACSVSHSTLCELKRELADYNMHTGKWKEQQ